MKRYGNTRESIRTRFDNLIRESYQYPWVRSLAIIVTLILSLVLVYKVDNIFFYGYIRVFLLGYLSPIHIFFVDNIPNFTLLVELSTLNIFIYLIILRYSNQIVDLKLKQITQKNLHDYYKPNEFVVFENRSTFINNIPKILNNAEKKVEIFGLELLFLTGKEDIRDEIERAVLNKKILFRILSISPLYSESVHGSTESTRKENLDNWITYLNDTTRRWKNLFSNKNTEFSDYFSIQFYDFKPEYFYLIVDNRLFFYPYLAHNNIRDVPVVELKPAEEKKVLSMYSYHFDTIWLNKSKTISVIIKEYEISHGT
jgi:hypothetical protein